MSTRFFELLNLRCTYVCMYAGTSGNKRAKDLFAAYHSIFSIQDSIVFFLALGKNRVAYPY